tara:strand:+ start:1395 stop:1586 length:192 start_codon:yes stop_codon:yes gene_type:complete
MKKKSIQDMFSEVVKKAGKSKQKIPDGSILKRFMASDVDHYRVCPFRSIPVEDCPLCTLDKLG